ncbi:MAG TPA: hypothetical protein VIG90_11080 [Pedomonas sp.]|uniref:gp53-like domain-containing protein n=1 Tax=Pedomonas sp. TaxID=2976421 RepID=UPI002F4216CF
MSGLILTVTNAGRAALVNLPNTGTNAVLMASVGVSATSFTPSPATASLPGEIKRISTIAGEAVANDTIHVTVRDESNAVYTVRSFGLYLSDGTLFAVYSQANPIMEKSAQAMLLLAIDVAFADINANQISFGDTFFINPPATTERQGVVELATDAEATTGIDATRAVTPKGLKGAVTSWLNTRFGDGAPSPFVKGLLTSSSAAALRLSLGLKSAALKDEGAGKGLDADLLDGEHGDYYKNIPARLGYTPANKAGDTFTGDILVAANVQSAKAMRATGNILSGSADYLGTGIEIGGDQAGGRGFVYAYDRSAASWKQLLLAGSELVWKQGSSSVSVPVWHAGNDGAGSGLDAGLLGGFTPSQYIGPASVYHDYAAYGLKAARGGYYGILFGETLSATAAMFNAEGVGGFYQRQTSTPGQARWHLYTDGSDWYAGPLPGQNRMWNAGNDGAGSGLDADLLDGLQAAAFAQLSGATFTGDVKTTGRFSLYYNNAPDLIGLRTVGTAMGQFNIITGSPQYQIFRWEGSNFIEKMALTEGGVLSVLGNTVWHAGNDGAGSGLDADLLDGQQGSYYSNIPARLGYTPANKSGETFTGDVSVGARILSAKGIRAAGDYGVGASSYLETGIEIGGHAAANRAFVYAYDRQNTAWKQLQLAGSELVWTQGGGSTGPIWHSGNDGSGSGLDADTLDGLHGSDYAKVADFIASKTTNGYCRLPNGMIIQAGRFTASNDTTVTVTFPIAFPSLCMGVVVSGTAHLSADAQDNNPAVRNGTVLLNQFQVFNAADTTQAFFIAFGY